MSALRSDFRRAYAVMRLALRNPRHDVFVKLAGELVGLHPDAQRAGVMAAVRQSPVWDGRVQPPMVCRMGAPPEGVRSRVFAYRILGVRARRRPIPGALA